MTTQEIISFFENIIDDTLDSDFELDLANDAKDEIEDLRPWRMLLKIDSSGTSGGDYTTQKTLPADFKDMVRVVINKSEYDQFPFELRMEYENCGGRYCVDMVNSKYYIAEESNGGNTIYLFYIYQTPDLTLLTSPVWPARYHKLIAYDMALLYFAGLEIDEITANQAKMIQVKRDRLLDKMEKWDSRLQLQAMDHSTPMRNSRRDSGATSGRVDIHNL